MVVLVVMVLPMPAFAVDLLIVLNITLSLIILMVGMYVRRPKEFSSYPSVLLVVTLFRLAINVATTRRILLFAGDQGPDAAGHMVKAFGQFVVGGSYVIGLVVFLILLAIQFLVINHGAGRIAEVTARFTLDALPGKQMAIDADLNAGYIDEQEARKRRKDLQEEAGFYGAMDGAVKFTQRDAVAALIILAVNIVAGVILGVVQYNLPVVQAMQTYTLLTVGDGLVTVIPSLLVSVGGAILTTRTSSDASGLGSEVMGQLGADFRPMAIAAATLFLFGAVPGLPLFPFWVMAAIFGVMAYAAWGSFCPSSPSGSWPPSSASWPTPPGSCPRPPRPRLRSWPPPRRPRPLPPRKARTRWKACSRWTPWVWRWATASSPCWT
jgi:flagellar biosynthesis protein FlhA